MKKMITVIMVSGILASMVGFASVTAVGATIVTNTPFVTSTVRSPLGKEIDALKMVILNLDERLAKLEAEEAERKAKAEASAKRREELRKRREEAGVKKATVANTIKRGKKKGAK